MGMQHIIVRTHTLGLCVDGIPTVAGLYPVIEDALSATSAFLMAFVNPGTVVLAKREPALPEMLKKFDVVAPDGIGMALAVQWLHDMPVGRVSFDTTSLAPWVMHLAVDRHLKVVLCGGRATVAERAACELHRAYRGLNIVGSFDGYGDVEHTIRAVRQVEPDIVVCGMGSPKQEAFLLALAARGWSGVGFTCGGFLDQLTEKGVNYYPALVNKLNLRWVYRLIMEPRRLWRRYLLDYPEFALRLCRALIRRLFNFR